MYNYSYFQKCKYTNPEDFADVLLHNRVVHLHGAPQMADYRPFYANLVQKAGSFVKVNEDYRTGDQNEQIADWLDIRFDDVKKTETFRHSDTHQPLHTDNAYNTFRFDVSFFFCEESAPIGGATTFIDGPVLIDIMAEYEPELLKELETHEIIFDKGQHQRRVEKTVRYDEKGPLLNWNYYRISTENPPEILALCERFQWFLENKIHSGGLLMPVYLKKGEAAFFHDDRVLHGRNAFFGPRCLIKGGLNIW